MNTKPLNDDDLPQVSWVCKCCKAERDPRINNTCPKCSRYDWYAGKVLPPKVKT